MNSLARIGLGALVSLVALPAAAHHPLGGLPMETFSHGLLSGIGHPLLGFDHLFFVAVMGIAAAFTGRRFVAPLGYLAAMIAGVALVVGGVALPFVEQAIAVSLLVLGGLVMAGRAIPLAGAVGLFALAGLFHGWAFGEALAGQEGGAPVAVTAGYLLGLAAVQYAIAVAAGLAVTAGLRAATAQDMPARLSGAMAAGAGAFLCLEVLEGAAFAALGLG
ncbi:MAG: HupE/UreJ family protein [Paracoccaceae bacterium]